MTKTRTNTSPESIAEAVAWVTRQWRFEDMIGSLERRIANQLDDVANDRRS